MSAAGSRLGILASSISAGINWDLWNNTGSSTYINLGSTSIGFDYGIAVVCALDYPFFIAITGFSQDTVQAVIGQFNGANTPPTFGTPVTIDSTMTLGASLVYEGFSISNNLSPKLICCAYTFFNPVGGVGTYRMRLIGRSGMAVDLKPLITLSTNTAPNLPSRATGLIEPLAKIGTWWNDLTSGNQVAALSINMSTFALTLGTPVTLSSPAITATEGMGAFCCLQSTNEKIIVGGLNNSTNQFNLVSFNVSGLTLTQADTKVVDTDSSAGFTGFALTRISDTEVIVGYCATSSTPTNDLRIRDYEVAFDGTLTGNEVQIVHAFSIDCSLGLNSFINIPNTLNQRLLSYYWQVPNNRQPRSQAFICLTPQNGPALIASDVPIVAGSNNGAQYSNSEFFTDQIGMFIVPQYDMNNAGLKFLEFGSAFDLPFGIFEIDATNVGTYTPTNSSSFGPASGSIGTPTVTVTGVDLTKRLPAFTNLVLSGTTYRVASSVFTSGNTVFTLTSNLLANLVGVDTIAQLCPIINDTINSYVFSSGGADSTPMLGLINAQPTFVNYLLADFTTGSSFFNTSINFLLQTDATFFIVIGPPSQANASITTMHGWGLNSQLDILVNSVETGEGVSSDSVFGSFTISQLTLLTIVRKQTGSKVYVNGVLNDTANNYPQSVIGELITMLFGNAYGCAISYANLWVGAMGDSQRGTIETGLISKFSIT